MRHIDRVGKIGKRAYRRLWIGALIILILSAGIAGCSPATQTPTATQTDLTISPTQRAAATETPTALPTSYTPDPTATGTSAPATSMPNPSPTPFELAQNQALSFVRDGTPLPEDLAVIGPENLTRLSELGRWGKGEILTMAYAPDGSQVAAVTSQGVYFYSTDTYELVRFVPIEGVVEPVVISSSLRYLATGDWTGIIKIWDLQTGQLFHTLQTDDNPIEVVAFTPDESRVYASDIDYQDSQNEKTYLWNLQIGQLIAQQPFGAEEFVFSVDGKTLVTKHDNRILVWQENNLEKPQEILSAVYDFDSPLALSMDGELLAVGNNEAWNMQIDIWELRVGKLQKTLYMQDDQGNVASSIHLPAEKIQALTLKNPASLSGPGGYWVYCLAFSTDGRKLAALNAFGLLHQWVLDDSKLLSVTLTDSKNVIYSPTGDVLAAWRYSASFYKERNSQFIYILGNHAGDITDLEFAPNSYSLATASLDGKVWWRRVQVGEIIRTFKAKSPNTKHSSAIVYDVDFARDGSLIVAGAGYGLSYLWSTNSGESSVIQSQCSMGIHAISLSYDNQYLAMHPSDCEIEIIHLKDKVTQTIMPRAGYLYIPLAFSPVYPWLAVAADVGVDIISIPDLASIASFGNFEMGEASPRFSEDGQLLAIADGEGAFEVWDVIDGNLVMQYEIPPKIFADGTREISPVSRFAISPNNQLLATSIGSKVMFYDLKTNHGIGILQSSGDAVDFSPDGRLLAVGGADGVIYIYGVPLNE